MFYLRYCAVPAKSHPERKKLGEAYVCCWIERSTLEEADRVAQRELKKEKWSILERECVNTISEADYAPDDEDLEYYQQALELKEVFVYHMSPRYPVYQVTASVKDRSTGEMARAHYFLCGDSILHEGEDIYDPDFWTGERQQTAQVGARDAITEAGWEILELLEERPCGARDLSEDLVPYYDEAEDAGACLVFVHDRAEDE